MDRIWHFFARHSVDLADRTEAALRSAVTRLLDFPEMGQPRPRLGIRELLLAEIQYRIGYRALDDELLIVSVRSTREKV